MGILDRWFGKQARRLDGPQDLASGDIVRFKLYAPGCLAGERFVVEAVTTYRYQGSEECEFVLRGNGPRVVFLTVVDDDGEQRLWLSAKLSPGEVTTLFAADELAAIFDDEGGDVGLTLRSPSAVPADLDGWFSERYLRTVYSLPGEFFKADCRREKLPEQGEELDYYCLTNEDESRAMVFEVYDGGDEVMACVLAPTDLIEELWPAEQPSGGR